MRVLVVEDEFLIADMIEGAVTDAGFECVGIAPSTSEALEMAAAEKPDFVTLDLRLRNSESGLETGRILKKVHGLRALVVSGFLGEVPLEKEGLDPLGHLPKPFTDDALVRALREAAQQLKAH